MAATNLIGLDIGTVSVRAAEIGMGKGGPVIKNFAAIALPPGAAQSGVVHDERAVTAALKELWATAKFSSRNVILGVSNPQVVVREMTVTNLPPKELRRALPFQVRDALPLPVEKSILDFYPLENAAQNENIRGLLIAAPKEPVIAAVQATERAGLHVVRVDLASIALLRAVSRLDDNAEAIVDMGAYTTSVVVHIDGVPLIVRIIPRGGVEITETVAKRLNLTQPEAEALKCRIGLKPSPEEEESDAAEVIRDAVRPLVNEIRNSFNYLNLGDRQTQVARLTMSGGTSTLPGLLESLRAQLQIDVVAADPILRLRGLRRVKHGDLETFRPSAAVAVGLALGAAA